MTTRARLAIILVTVPVLAFVVVGGLLARTASQGEPYPSLRVFDDVFSLTTSSYVERVDAERLMHGAMHGLAEALDADSAYLTPDEAALANSTAPLPTGEVGIELTRQYYLRVVAVRDGSPAARAGVRGGDFIRIIDRQPTRDMSVWEGARMLRGQPGSTVTLTMLRGNAIDAHVVELTREVPARPAVTARVAANGVGVVRIASFTNDTPTALREAIGRVQRESARGVVVDLRSCGGGPLAAGIEAARLFIGTGTIGQLETKGATRQTVEARQGDGKIPLPLAVLVDRGTAGPAELFAAAVSGHKRGELLGERTAGRVAVQRVFPLPDGSALWMSYACYLTTTGEPIHDRGVQPDIVIEQPDPEFGVPPAPGDPTLDRAIERLRARSAS